jgi:hypothetical protein
LVHVPSEQHRQEFMACPILVRLTMAQTDGKLVPTLLIKSTALSLRYLVRKPQIRLMFFALESGPVGYGVEITDDQDKPVIVWSLISYQDEIEAILQLSRESRCIVHLFNEIAVNVAWVDASIPIGSKELAARAVSASRCPARETDKYRREVGALLDQFRAGSGLAKSVIVLDSVDLPPWQEVNSVYLTRRGVPSPISIFSDDEGGQQEALAHWLLDQLKADGVVRSPQVVEGKGKTRELTDLLLSYDRGAFLIESKALAILGREDIPNRAKLVNDVSKHVRKAVSQLKGAIKNLKRGCTVTDLGGAELAVDRTNPVHAIVLVPDLTLLNGLPEFGRQTIQGFGRKTRSFLHLLDPSELLRLVQDAELLSSMGGETKRMMAFDAALIERFKHACKLDTADFDFLLRIVPAKTAEAQ